MKEINFGQFNTLYDFYSTFPNEKTCIDYLEKLLWPNGVVSPYDKNSKVYRRGDGLYRCKNTGKNFNVRIGTIFESQEGYHRDRQADRCHLSEAHCHQ